MKGLITAAGLRNRQTQLPDSHRVVGAVVVAGDGVEVRQSIPVLIAGTNIQAQQAGLLMITQRLLWRQTRGSKLRNAVLVLKPFASLVPDHLPEPRPYRLSPSRGP